MHDSPQLSALRKHFKKSGIVGFIQPVSDEYMSEYPPACNRRLEWVTGFSGSAGTVVVLANKAALFTDGRYTLQAELEVDGALFERHNSGTLTPEAWLAEEVRSGERIGYDPRVYTQAMIEKMEKVLAPRKIMLVPVANIIDLIWDDRPAKPISQIFMHEVQYSGEESSAKRKRLAQKLEAQAVDYTLVTAPDAVCWLLNIRAGDVEHTPLLLTTAILSREGKVQLFVDYRRCNKVVFMHLGEDVELCDPGSLESRLIQLGKGGKRVMYDPASVPLWFTQVLEKAGAKLVAGQDVCLLPKACKNPVEIDGICKAHIRDGVAITRLLSWLEAEVTLREVTELDVSEKLLLLRAESPLFVEPSFTTIAGSGPHGAIVHYRATPQSNRALKKGELFLLDSGGQYLDGTTDITRTIAIGEPTREHKDRFTRVLRGHIALATVLFPSGTSGSQLDVLARQFLWQAGLDYDHGTGHGVGCFLGVHEGPQRIAKRGGDVALQPGMVLSNEPGYYKPGAYGIRIENLVAVTRQAHGQDGRDWLGFETITCAPLDSKLVDGRMLTPIEKDWFNAYQAWVVESLSDQLTMQERQWLAARCAPLRA